MFGLLLDVGKFGRPSVLLVEVELALVDFFLLARVHVIS